MRIKILSLILLLNFSPLLAQEEVPTDAKSVEQKLAQKIKMINVILHSPDMLKRVEESGDSVAQDLLARAAQNFLTGEEYFDRGLYLEAEAVLDYVLRDLSAGSRLISRPQQKSSEFQQYMEQLDSFALPEWGELTEQETEALQSDLTQVSEMRDRAARLADVSSYDEAIELLEQAYQLKVSLLERYPHETTIVYDLSFDTVQDEYRYMSNRTYHYLDLVQTALAQSEVDAQTRKLTDKYLYDSMLNLEAAEDLESQGQFSEAIPVLDKSINRLLSVLKILGITI